MLNDSRTRAPLRWLALAGLSTLASLAQADTAQAPAAAPQRSDGVMSFANVRVEVATPKAAATSTRQSADAGLVATIDPATGKLTQPSADDMASLQPAAAPSALRQRSLAVIAPKTVRSAAGGVGLALDTAQDSYAVVRRNADGTLEEVCAPGEEHALKTLATQPAMPVKGEVK